MATANVQSPLGTSLKTLVKIPAWAIIVGGRQAVHAEISKKLEEYETQIKAKGLHEYPSALDKHAEWWFEHYVHSKKYKELDQGYPSPNAESIKKAVWKFTKLVGIKVK